MAYTILLADDDPVVAHIVASMLQGAGHRVVRAASGERCLELIRDGVASGSLPDLVLLDVQLLDMTGHAVLNEIRVITGTQRLPTVMISSNSEAETAKAFPNLDADGYLEKPFTPQRVQEIVEATVARLRSSSG